VKRGSGLSRQEEEIKLEPAQFEALWPLTEGRRLRKRRHSLGHGELTIEVDVYEGELSGLVVAEVEFPSEEDARRFEPPDWFDREVTGDEAYLNESLAVYGVPDG
jgi:adenylate cyclase